ncbi:unnamed protein product, partial [Rotaria sp. Silwood2]
MSSGTNRYNNSYYSSRYNPYFQSQQGKSLSCAIIDDGYLLDKFHYLGSFNSYYQVATRDQQFSNISSSNNRNIPDHCSSEIVDTGIVGYGYQNMSSNLMIHVDNGLMDLER